MGMTEPAFDREKIQEYVDGTKILYREPGTESSHEYLLACLAEIDRLKSLLIDAENQRHTDQYFVNLNSYRRGLTEAYEICQAEMRHKDRPILFASDSAWRNACNNCAERISALMDNDNTKENERT